MLTHRAEPGGQLAVQVPLTHAVPAPQTCPQLPQFRLSLCKLVQTWLLFGPGQATSPAVQAITQAPLRQA
jgi:hypothetical protein